MKTVTKSLSAHPSSLHLCSTNIGLVGGFNPSEKYWSIFGSLFPIYGTNKRNKPPTSGTISSTKGCYEYLSAGPGCFGRPRSRRGVLVESPGWIFAIVVDTWIHSFRCGLRTAWNDMVTIGKNIQKYFRILIVHIDVYSYIYYMYSYIYYTYVYMH